MLVALHASRLSSASRNIFWLIYLALSVAVTGQVTGSWLTFGHSSLELILSTLAHGNRDEETLHTVVGTPQSLWGVRHVSSHSSALSSRVLPRGRRPFPEQHCIFWRFQLVPMGLKSPLFSVFSKFLSLESIFKNSSQKYCWLLPWAKSAVRIGVSVSTLEPTVLNASSRNLVTVPCLLSFASVHLPSLRTWHLCRWAYVG